MSLAIDYFAFDSNAFDFYRASSSPSTHALDTFEAPETHNLGRQTPASLQSLSYDSILIPSSVIGASEASRQKLLRELEGYATLQAGWDGYEGEPANPQSIIDARVFISSLPSQLRYPKPMLASDGEVSLFWEAEGQYLEASFPGDCTYHYIFNAPGIRVGADDVPVSSPKLEATFLSYLACF